jgi:hypothetical protein
VAFFPEFEMSLLGEIEVSDKEFFFDSKLKNIRDGKQHFLLKATARCLRKFFKDFWRNFFLQLASLEYMEKGSNRPHLGLHYRIVQ